MKDDQRIETINSIIKERRSSFPMEFNGQKIDKAILDQILINANWAPNHGKTEPWRFKVFHGESIMNLAKFMAEHYKVNTQKESFSEVKYNRFLQKAERTSHVIGICMKRDPMGKIPEIEEVAAVSCAVQNIYISITAYNLRGYWSTGGGTYSKEMHSFLKLKKDES